MRHQRDRRKRNYRPTHTENPGLFRKTDIKTTRLKKEKRINFKTIGC